MEPDAVLDRLIDAIVAGDQDAARSAYHPDARIWHNFDQVEQTVDENLRTLGWMVTRLPERRYEDVVRYAIEGGIVQTHVLRGTTSTGATLEMPACLVVHVSDGRITRLEEYLDTAQAAALAG